MTRISRHAWPLGVAAAAFTVAVGLPGGDPDSWWHLASGRWMVEHREALHVDVFSSTATGEPYALGEWLGEIVLYAAYAAASWTGVAVLRALCVAVAAFALTRSALRVAPPAVAVPVAGLALVLSKPIWTDRPQLFTIALFPLALELLLAARAGSRGALVATVPLVVVWSDLHAGYALGLALIWLVALDALLERHAAGALLAAAAIATAVVAVDPGALPLLGAADHVASASRAIVEESPVDVLTPFGALFTLFVGATLVLFLRGGAPLLAALILLPVLLLALTAQRHVPFFGFAAVPFLASPMARLVGDVGTTLRRKPLVTALSSLRTSTGGRVTPGRGARHAYPHQIDASPHQIDAGIHDASEEHLASTPTRASSTPRSLFFGPSSLSLSLSFRRRLGLGIAVALWLGAIASIAAASPAPDVRAYPVGAASALRSTSGVLLNEYDWGGWLIWNVPERPVFVDGRLFPFTASGVLAQHREALLVLPGWHATMRRWDVAQALLRPDRPLAQALRDDGWTVVSESAGYVLLERPR